jgi:Cupin-like domain
VGRQFVLTLSETPRVGAVSKGDFQDDFSTRGKAVILEQLTAQWPARERWCVAYLKRVAGDVRIPLYDSRPAQGREHQHALSRRMLLGDYLELLSAGENELRVFFLNVRTALPRLLDDFSYPDLGLRWLRRLPVLFMGGRGARVQMHFDADLADTLLCHFGGKKRVVLFAPDQTPYLYHVPFSFSALFGVQPDAVDYERYPALRHATGEVAELHHGDALYIPPGYWHYVVYDDIGFSLSLRALPRAPQRVLASVYNVVVLRTAEALMRKLLGQRWSDRNERVAVERTHRRLGLSLHHSL